MVTAPTSRAWLMGVLAALGVVAAMPGCGESKPGAEGNPNGTAVIPGALSCGRDGDQSTCTVELGRKDGVVSCAKGVKTCANRLWGPCVTSTSKTSRYTMPEPPPRVGDPGGATGVIKGLALASSPTSCADNPCDLYCQQYADVPDAALTGDSTTVITYTENLTFDTLENGNPPSGFQSKANDYQGVCGLCYPAASLPYSASQTCQEACQFDSYCLGNGQNGCQMFESGEKNGCTGIDVTTPVVCTMPVGAGNDGLRRLKVCNRGTDVIAANSGIACWTFPGGSPQYPDYDPVAHTNNGSLVDTFNEEIKAGDCAIHYLPGSAFGASGTQSVMCNVRQKVTSIYYVPSSTGYQYGSHWFDWPSTVPWTNASNISSDVGGETASVTFAQTTTAARAPTTSSNNTGGWTNLGNIGTTNDLVVASGSVAAGSNPSPSTQSVRLSGFGLDSLIPSGAFIDSITTTVRWRIDANNSKASLTATPYVYGVPFTAMSDTTLDNTWETQTWTSVFNGWLIDGTALSDANFYYLLSGTTVGNAFVASVDSLTVTVKYKASGYYASIYTNNYGFNTTNFPLNGQTPTLDFEVRWSSSDPNTQLCLYSNAGGYTYQCTTYGASPTSLTTYTTGMISVTPSEAHNLWAAVYAWSYPGTTAPTVNIDYIRVRGRYLLSPYDTGVDECNIHNNWSVAKANPEIYCPGTPDTTYYNFSKSRVFEAVCPAGTKAVWRMFGWDSTDPGASKIEFRFRSFDKTVAADGTSSCVALAAALADPPSAIATAQSTPTNTQVCPVTSVPVGSCPANLNTYLGQTGSEKKCLQMDAFGIADPKVAAPTLTSWTPTYDCMPSE